MIQKTMWAYKAEVENIPTFKLLVTDSNSPFLEAAYDPNDKLLVVLSKQTTTLNVPTPRLDAKGKENGVTFKLIDRFFEHHITDLEDIKEFIKNNVSNPKAEILKILDE